VLVEEQTACCYAVQTKAWVTDPDGNRWEVFVNLDDDAAARATAGAACCEAAAACGDARDAIDACCEPSDACCEPSDACCETSNAGCC
jgi:hypothetical protein